MGDSQNSPSYPKGLTSQPIPKARISIVGLMLRLACLGAPHIVGDLVNALHSVTVNCR